MCVGGNKVNVWVKVVVGMVGVRRWLRVVVESVGWSDAAGV